MAVPCIGTVTAPLASPMTLAEGCGEPTCRCGGATSRPVTERSGVELRPSGSATVTEMVRGPSGMGARMTVFWYWVPVNCSVVVWPSQVMLTVRGKYWSLVVVTWTLTCPPPSPRSTTEPSAGAATVNTGGPAAATWTLRGLDEMSVPPVVTAPATMSWLPGRGKVTDPPSPAWTPSTLTLISPV